jgi:hypothetical protein
MRSSWRCACSKACAAAVIDACADIRLSRMEVWSRRTSRSPFFTGSPFSLSTASTTAGTSARRSARRSGSTEPVIDGPEVSALLRTTSTSSCETSSGAAAASGVLPAPLLHPVSARPMSRPPTIV